MTEYFIREMPAGVSGKYNARGKAREDMERILVDEHILPVDIQPLEGNREHLSVGGSYAPISSSPDVGVTRCPHFKRTIFSSSSFR